MGHETRRRSCEVFASSVLESDSVGLIRVRIQTRYVALTASKFEGNHWQHPINVNFLND